MIRTRFNRSETIGEKNNGIIVTMPDLSLSVRDIIDMYLSGQDPNVEYVPDRSHFEDFSEYMPNVDELGVLSPPNNENEQPVNSPNNDNLNDDKGDKAVTDTSPEV